MRRFSSIMSLSAILTAFLAFLLVSLAPRVALAKTGRAIGDPLRLEVPGSPDAFYYKPRAKGPKPVLMYLHGRGGNPAEDCRKWAKVGSQFGWVVCPVGPRNERVRAAAPGPTARRRPEGHRRYRRRRCVQSTRVASRAAATFSSASARARSSR